MKKKNRKLRAALCICAALLILSMAVFANYDNAGGYTAIKNGVKGMLYEDNMTINGSLDISLDGVSLGGWREMTYKIDNNGDPSYYLNETFGDAVTSTGHYEVTEQDGDRFVISEYTDETGQMRTSKFYYPGSARGMWFDTDGDVFNKGVNFAETLSDVLVGDIKNNIVLAQTDGSSRTYSLNMSGDQLPKYMTAAFSFICAGSRNDGMLSDGSDGDAILNNMMINPNEPYISNVCGNVTLDERDRITAFDGSFTITGYDENNNVHDLSFNAEMTVSDYGTTVIDRVNPDEYRNVQSGEMHAYYDDGEAEE